MTQTLEKIRVVIVDDNGDTLNNLRKLLYFEKDIEIVATASSGKDGIQAAVQYQPDVVLMDINMPGMDGIAASEVIHARVPVTQIIIMSVQAEADYLRRAMMAGARDFLIKPFSSEQLASTVRKVHALGNGAQSHPSPGATAALQQTGPLSPATTALPAARADTRMPTTPVQTAPSPVTMTFTVAPPAPAPTVPADNIHLGKVFAIVSANGGVGRSTIASNLAIALKAETQGKVGLVDCSLHFGDIGVLLNLTSNHTIADIASAEGGADTEIVVDVMSSHASGVKVLLAPSAPELAELVSPRSIRTILSALREHFDFVVVDTFTSLDETMLAVLDTADKILLLTTSEIPSIKNTKQFFEIIDALKYPTDKTLLVLNKYDAKSSVKPEHIEASIKHPVFTVIERDDRATTQAAQTGQPFVVNQRNATATIAVQRLSRMLVAPPEPVAAGAEAKPARRGLLR